MTPIADLLPPVRPLALALFLPLALGACASLVEDRGFAAVQAATEETLGKEVVWIRTEEAQRDATDRVRKLLRAPLTADTATQVALLNNRGLQAAYHQLGRSAADMVAALTPPNPGFSFSRLKSGGVLELERSISLDVLGLLTLPVAASIEDRRWEQAKLQAIDDVLQVATEARVAFYGAVAAEQLVAYMEQAKLAAEASAELARRLGQTGAYGKLQQAREQVFRAELLVQYARARKARTAARERLTRALGLWDLRHEIRLPERLPDLPKSLPERRDLEATGLEQRLDLRMARLEVDGLARSYGLTQATRFVNVLEASYLDKRETGSPIARGYEISITVPIFDFGTTRVAQAEHTYMQAVNRLAEMAVAARSQIRERYEEYRLSHDLAQHYQRVVVPGRKVISDEQLLRYNGMLVGVFELLADARDQIASVVAAIEAQRDFWEADAGLDATLLSGAPLSGGMASRPASAGPAPAAAH